MAEGLGRSLHERICTVLCGIGIVLFIHMTHEFIHVVPVFYNVSMDGEPVVQKESTPVSAATYVVPIFYNVSMDSEPAVQQESTPVSAAAFVVEEDCQAAIKLSKTRLDDNVFRYHHGAGDTWEVSYDGCMLRMNASQANNCLSRKSPNGVLMMGDSLTRYQYLNFVYFLETGLDLSPADSPNENEHLHSSWKEFYKLTNGRLGGHEICDCQRGEPYNAHPLENRYYYNPDTGARAAYVQLGGPGQPVRRHEFNASTGKLDCLPGYCPPVDTEPPKLIHYLNFSDAITRVTEELAPSDAFYNAGLHLHRIGEGFPSPANVAYLTAAATRLANISRMHWKTTTEYPGISLKGVEEEYEFAKTLMEGGFSGTFDTRAITKGLLDEAARLKIPLNQLMWDEVHFQPQVYAAINQIFLVYLCRSEPVS